MKRRANHCLAGAALVLLLAGCGEHVVQTSSPPTLTARVSLSLNGDWDVAQGAMDDAPPSVFDRRVPVPGLIDSATPLFEEIGVKSALRRAFWYRRTFAGPEPAQVALLRIHKAQYGSKVWLNGTLLGEHAGAFTVGEYDARAAIKFGADNELVVRLGADPSEVPATVPVASDREKHQFIPGIYDDVELALTGELTIVRTKIEPDLARDVAVIRTTVANRSRDAASLAGSFNPTHPAAVTRCACKR